MLDLLNNKYDINILIENIYDLHLLEILRTQQLTSDFIVMYILNKNYQLTKEEENITLLDIFTYQPHITKMEINNSFHNKSTKIYFPNFEEIALK
jgi:hypothetical protein